MKGYKELKKLYKKFVRFEKEKFTNNVEKWLGVKELSLSSSIYKKVYEYYLKPTFVEFINKLRYLIFWGPLAFLKKAQEDVWNLLWFLQFLESENLVKIEKNKIEILGKDILQGIIIPLTKEKILKILQKKLKISISKYLNYPVVSSLSNLGVSFRWKEYFDQLPISTSSAILLIEKVLEYLPLEERILIIGDDDFISILLGFVNPKINITVVDIDEEVLSLIEKVSKKFGFSVDVKKIDVENGKMNKKFISFLTNPPYTENGVKAFVKFGLSCLGKDGGICFLEVGNEAIGKRFILLQEFFAKHGLWLKELLPSFISYSYTKHEEFDLVISEFEKMQLNIKNNIMSADLYIFNYVPWELKKLKFRSGIYSYL